MPFPKPLQLCLFLIACSTTAAAQPVTDLRFEKVNGLSQNTVYSLMKDQQGFMWIATADGLNRYDGVEMKIYKPPAEKRAGQLRGRTIRSRVLEDNREHLWFSTELSVFDFNKKTNYFQEYLLGLKDNKALELNADPILQKGDKLWLANSSYGLIEFDTTTRQNKNFSITDSAGKLTYIQPSGVHDNKERLWFASNKGLFAFNIVEKKWRQFLPGRHLYKVAISGDTIYANAGNEVFFFNINDQQWGKVSFDVNNSGITALYTDHQQNIWAGDEKGNVYCKKRSAAGFHRRGNINGEDINQTVYPVYCFYVDEQGTLWVGADVLGLLRTTINPLGFQVYPLAEEKKKTPNFFVTSIYEDGHDQVWLGTFQMGLILLNKKTGLTNNISLPEIGEDKKNENLIGFIKKDDIQNLWIGASGKLLLRESGAITFKVLKIPLPINSLATEALPSSLIKYKNGWLVGTSLGLYFLTKTNDHYSFEYLSSLGQSRISEVWVDKKEMLWIAFEGLGLFLAKDLTHLKESEILFAETGIKSFLYEEQHQLLWIATQSGLVAFHLPTRAYKNFTEQDGLGNSFVYGALKNKDQLWLSTNRGLSKAIVSFKKGQVLPTLSFTNFTSNDGLPNDEFNTGAFYKDSSGIFYFGTIKGVVWFDPDEIKPNRYLPKIIMTGILVNGETADSSISPEYISQLQLPYNKNSLFFHFRGIEYSNASKVNYAYKLKGWDKDWIYSGTLNEVRYNNLPQGNYLFEVRAANASGIWNETMYQLPVVVYPPFWKTWWFYSLGILLVIGVIILITKNVTSHKLKKEIEKLERQKALEEERLRISQEMHDDIGAGLTQISLISEAAKGQSRSGNEIRSELEDISFTSRQLVDNISEIIWALNPLHCTLDTLLAHLREKLHKLLEYAVIDYSIHFPVNIPPVELNDKQRRNILLVTKEIVHNALKHSKAKTLTVTATLIEKQLKFIITDNGVGFNKTLYHQGNGLKNIRRRIQELKGDLAIESKVGEGTVFTYSFTL